MSARQVVRSRLSFFFSNGDTPASDNFLFRELTPAPDRYLGENTDPPGRSVPPTSGLLPRAHTGPRHILGGSIRTLPDAPFSNPLSGSIRMDTRHDQRPTRTRRVLVWGSCDCLRGAIVPPDVREDIAPLNSILERGYRY